MVSIFISAVQKINRLSIKVGSLMRVAISPDLLVALTGQSRSQLKELLSTQPASCLENAESLCAWLQGQGLLTKYQAEHAVADRGEGLIVGQYVVLDELGHGSVGMVYKARHRLMGRLSALKVFTSDDQDSENHKRFLREIQATAQLDHPHLVKAYEAGEHVGAYYLAIEYVEGENLQKRVETQGAMPLAQALPCFIQAASGLGYAHSLGMVHRDVKPANIMLGNDGRVLVLDLGLVRLTSGCSSMFNSIDGSVRGTAAFMAPEQALSIRDADHRSDIYGLGASLFYVLTGQVMFQEKVIMQQLVAHQKKPAPPLRQFLPAAPAELDQVYFRMVAKNPDDRFQSMVDVVQSLEAIVQGKPLPFSVELAPRQPSSSTGDSTEETVIKDPLTPSGWRRFLPF
jgi:serine/threonine-protein kinase